MKHFKFIIYTVSLLVLLMDPLAPVFGQLQSFQPGEIWPDDNGVHINAHGGGFLFYEGTYYWFGEHKTGGRGGNRANV